MADITDRGRSFSFAAGRVLDAFARPRAVAIGCVILLSGLGWAYLGVLAGGASDTSGLWSRLCGPLGPALAARAFDPLGLLLALAMWSAMALAMMLPTAAPMIVTYGEIAETAARKRMAVISPLILVAGYVAVWLSFAAAATLLQSLLAQFTAIENGQASRVLSGVLFVAAGLYQFSRLKQACLHVCQRPFPFFFANWKSTASGVFALGLRQGLYCLGCCWAMMALMLAVGAMNVLWMVALGIAMTLEKLSHTKRISRLLGVLLCAIGLGTMISTMM